MAEPGSHDSWNPFAETVVDAADDAVYEKKDAGMAAMPAESEAIWVGGDI